MFSEVITSDEINKCLKGGCKERYRELLVEKIVKILDSNGLEFENVCIQDGFKGELPVPESTTGELREVVGLRYGILVYVDNNAILISEIKFGKSTGVTLKKKDGN